MKKILKNHSWILALAGGLIFACISLPSTIILNHGSTNSDAGSMMAFMGEALISIGCIYLLFWLVRRARPQLRLEYALLLAFLLGILLYVPVYLFYWIVIIRHGLYGIPTHFSYATYFSQVFAVEVSMHLPVSLITITALYNHHLQKTRLELLNAEKMLAEGNLQNLIQQVDPHFLFNNLNILSALISIDPAQAVIFTNKLSDIYRQLLQTRHETVISLGQELQFARNYFYLLSCRFPHSMELAIENESDYSAEDLFVIPLSLQFLMENVVKHNILRASMPITIRITIRNHMLEVTNPVHKKHSTQKMGLGLQNLKERYYLLTQKPMIYGEKAGIFTVEIPIMKKFKGT